MLPKRRERAPAVLPPSLFPRRAGLGSPAEHHPLAWGGAELWDGSGSFWCDGPAATPGVGTEVAGGAPRSSWGRGTLARNSASQPRALGSSWGAVPGTDSPGSAASDQKNVSTPGLAPGSERRFQPELGQAERSTDPALPLCWVTQ